MNRYFVAAAGLMFAVAAVHSVLGELLIFRRLRVGADVPTPGGQLLRARHVGILWASWHVVTVLGCALAVLLLRWAQFAVESPAGDAAPIVAGAMAVSAALVGVGTRGRHPGWIALLIVALLVWQGTR